MRPQLLSFIIVTLLALSSAMAADSDARRLPMDADWLFHRGDVPDTNEVIATSFNDQAWQRVDLPHDYVLDGTYSETNDNKHGYLPLEVAWYRKHLFIGPSERGKFLRLDFDGIYRDSEVWLNGHYLGRHPSGYTPFSYDITHWVVPRTDNVIAVRVDPRGFEGHWYEGGGIYRHVYLTALAPLHLAHWGAYVIATVPGGRDGADAEADLKIRTTIQNDASAPANCQLVSEIIAPNGRVIRTIKTEESFPGGRRRDVAQQAVVSHPKLWSLNSPHLYQLRTIILQDGNAVDTTTTTFGIRTIYFDADKGFFLNGEHIEIQGVANHQDFPGVGIAVPDSLQEWRVAQLKKMGCNGWRTAHNPANEAVLDACDRLGMLVMDENRHLGDSFLGHSPPGTTDTNFHDLDAMILRDRNHPSVIMWSMCNEEGLRGKPEGERIFADMAREVRRLDSTRPITCAINANWITNWTADEDLLGVNYRYRDYDGAHRANPHVPMFGSETTNEKTTRGEYAEDRTNGWVTSYHLSEEHWLDIINRPFIAGSYTWTGFDYKGEPNPFQWPDVSNNTGLMDSCGFPKDKYYYFESCWSSKPMVHLLPDGWNWPGKDGQEIRVIAFSNARQVELFLNGRSLGAKEMPHHSHLEWMVPYQPGRLFAKASTDGKTVATESLETTGAPARITLFPARTTLHADDEDAVVVQVSILDDQGRIVPDAANRVAFQLAGNGRILGVGNGNPADHDPDRAGQRRAFHGHCIAVLEAGREPSTLRLTASSPGLTSASVKIKVP